MIPVSRTTYDDDIHSGRGGGADRPPMPNPLQIYRGTMGWKDDSEHADVGTADNGGRSLLKVTLNIGRHRISTEETMDEARGMQVLVQPMEPFYWIPKKGSPVLVLFPDGDIEAPGAGVLFGGASGSPLAQFGKNGAKIDMGPDMNLTLKARRITLMDYQNNFISVGLDTNIIFQTAGGTGGFISDNDGISFYVSGNGQAKSVLQMRTDKIKLINSTNGTTFIDMNAGKFTCYGDQSMWINGAAVYLGPGPFVGGLAAGVAYSTVGPANLISPSVFVSTVP